MDGGGVKAGFGATGEMSLKASVIVPTRNRPIPLEETLISLLAQNVAVDQCEIVVVDDGSEPPARVLEGVRVVRHDVSRGPNAARNTGLKETSEALVIFIDDDVEMPQGWLSSLLDATRHHTSAACFGGPIRLRAEGPTRVCSDCPTGETELDLEGGERETDHDMYSCNMMIRRSAVSAIGDFSEAQPIYFDEIEWQHRLREAGRSTVYVPDAWLWHKRTHRDMRVRNRIRRQFRAGYGRANFCASKGQSLEIPARLAGVPGLLLHSVRRRCAWGVLATAGELGALWWACKHRFGRPEVAAHAPSSPGAV